MNKYKCGNFTVVLLHYGNKLVFLRDSAGEEFTVQRDFFDENYQAEHIDYNVIIKKSSDIIKNHR